MNIEVVIMGLIQLALLVGAVYLIQYVFAQLSISIPENIMKVIWVIVLLVALLVVFRTILPGLGVRLGVVEPVARLLIG